jgi:hypothetical protein
VEAFKDAERPEVGRGTRPWHQKKGQPKLGPASEAQDTPRSLCPSDKLELGFQQTISRSMSQPTTPQGFAPPSPFRAVPPSVKLLMDADKAYNTSWGVKSSSLKEPEAEVTAQGERQDPVKAKASSKSLKARNGPQGKLSKAVSEPTQVQKVFNLLAAQSCLGFE